MHALHACRLIRGDLSRGWGCAYQAAVGGWRAMYTCHGTGAEASRSRRLLFFDCGSGWWWGRVSSRRGIGLAVRPVDHRTIHVQRPITTGIAGSRAGNFGRRRVGCLHIMLDPRAGVLFILTGLPRGEATRVQNYRRLVFGGF